VKDNQGNKYSSPHHCSESNIANGYLLFQSKCQTNRNSHHNILLKLERKLGKCLVTSSKTKINKIGMGPKP